MTARDLKEIYNVMRMLLLAVMAARMPEDKVSLYNQFVELAELDFVVVPEDDRFLQEMILMVQCDLNIMTINDHIRDFVLQQAKMSFDSLEV